MICRISLQVSQGAQKESPQSLGLGRSGVDRNQFSALKSKRELDRAAANGAVLDHFNRAESCINQDAENFSAIWALDLDIIDTVHKELGFDFLLLCITPQTFKVVEAATRFEEEVANDIAVIDHDPLTRG